MGEVFTKEELERLVKAVQKNGYIVGPMGSPPTYNLYKKWEQDMAKGGHIYRPPFMIDDYDRFYEISDYTEEQIEKALEMIQQYAYVFPTKPDGSVQVKINTHAMGDFDIEKFEEELLEALKKCS